MNKRVKITTANLFFMIFSLSFIIAQFFLAIVVALGFGKKILDNTYLILIITEIGFILIPSIIFAYIKKLDIKEVFKLHRLKLKPALLIILISIPASMVATMLNTIVMYLFQFIGNLPANQIPVPMTIRELLIGILIIGVLPGICEEVLNRGIMLNAYENRGSYKAVIITGIFFGVFHFDITNFFGPVVLGIILGFYAVRTNSILAPMLAHFLNNTIAESLSYLYRNEPAKDYIQIGGSELFFVILIGIVSTFIIWGLLKLFVRVTNDTAKVYPPISTVGNDTRAILTHYPIIIVIALYALLMLFYILTILFSKSLM